MGYRFNFKKYPDLKKMYEEYRRLELKATGYSMKDSESSSRKMLKTHEKINEYAYTSVPK